MTHDYSLHLGFVLGNPRLPFRAMVGHAAQVQAGQHGLSLPMLPTFTPDDQLAATTELIRRGVNGLLVLATDTRALGAAVRAATTARQRS